MYLATLGEGDHFLQSLLKEKQMSQKPITPEDIDMAIQKLRFPRPKISSDEAAKKAVALFVERPDGNHCAPSTVIVLQEAFNIV